MVPVQIVHTVQLGVIAAGTAVCVRLGCAILMQYLPVKKVMNFLVGTCLFFIANCSLVNQTTFSAQGAYTASGKALRGKSGLVHETKLANEK